MNNTAVGSVLLTLGIQCCCHGHLPLLLLCSWLVFRCVFNSESILSLLLRRSPGKGRPQPHLKAPMTTLCCQFNEFEVTCSSTSARLSGYIFRSWMCSTLVGLSYFHSFLPSSVPLFTFVATLPPSPPPQPSFTTPRQRLSSAVLLAGPPTPGHNSTQFHVQVSHTIMRNNTIILLWPQHAPTRLQTDRNTQRSCLFRPPADD